MYEQPNSTTGASARRRWILGQKFFQFWLGLQSSNVDLLSDVSSPWIACNVAVWPVSVRIPIAICTGNV